MTSDTQEMIKSWCKIFVAAVLSLYAAGERDVLDLLYAGAISILPLVYTWLDPNDLRFGRFKAKKK
jgi:hypothetical protein